ncbi:arylphorin subunit alpha-like [Neodiprion fabricii]|uniref:arylphorin subunit alpha-like n=1 Tax=Neodiprion fabricii TaxID=2872261 RepID=UPI001ED9022D|nr:arylphorin subunit alpha-like [Neodiprion fabricii]
MFRDILILTLAGFCLSAVTLVNADVANKLFLVKQEQVYDALWNPSQPELQPKMYEMGKSYKYETHMESYKNKDAFYEFLTLYKEKTLLPRGKIFSIFYPEHLHEAIVLFKVFYYAKDFETFYKTAAFARNFMNEGVYIYAFSLAVLHRPDTKSMRIPYFHEIYPYIFFNTEVIRNSYEALLYQGSSSPAQSSDNTIIIPANYSLLYSSSASQDDFKMMYFTEDVFFNELNYFNHLSQPFWMPSEEFNLQSGKRGEEYFFVQRMKYARYQLERFSNDLYEIPDFDFNYPIPRGYNPSLSYHNGYPVPHREPYATIPNDKFAVIRELRDLEYKIQEVIDSGYVFYKNGSFESIRTPNGLNVFGNLLAGNPESPNRDFYGTYGILARDVLGFSPAPRTQYDVVPSVLQNYGVDERDPMFWSYVQRIVYYYKEFASYLPEYTYEQMVYPDVKIESVKITDVETFFDTFDYTIFSTVNHGNVNDPTLIKARQYRLNHKPYSYEMIVNSHKAEKVVVNMFLGPKHVPGVTLADNYDQFMPYDQFLFDLKPGTNKLERSSTEFLVNGFEPMSSDVYYKEIQKAMSGSVAYEMPKRLFTYPGHISMPKGKPEGFPYQFFFYISPYNEEYSFEIESRVFGEIKSYSKSFGYPLDRPIYFPMEKLPNAFFKEFYVYHKDSYHKDSFHHTH